MADASAALATTTSIFWEAVSTNLRPPSVITFTESTDPRYSGAS